MGENIEHFNEVLIYWAVSSLIAPFVSVSVSSDYKTETSMFLQWENKHATATNVDKGALKTTPSDKYVA